MLIYKSFFRKKSTKKYCFIFLLLSLITVCLLFSKREFSNKENDIYRNSFIYFVSDENIDLSVLDNIKSYDKAFYVDCNNPFTSVFILSDNSKFVYNEYDNNVDYNICYYNDFELNYSIIHDFNFIYNHELYLLLSNSNDFYYFVQLERWDKLNVTYDQLKEKFNVDVAIYEKKIDDNDYTKIIGIFNFLINFMIGLFIILFVFTFINVIVDENFNSNLYYLLGFSKINIFIININKIIFIIFIPLLIILVYYLNIF